MRSRVHQRLRDAYEFDVAKRRNIRTRLAEMRDALYSSFHGWPGAVTHAVMLTTGFLGTLAALVLVSLEETPRMTTWAIAIVSAGALVIAHVVRRAELSLLPDYKRHPIAKDSNLGADTLETLQDYPMSPQEIYHFVVSVLDPPIVNSRIRESISPLTRAVEVKLEIGVSLPQGAKKEIAIPVRLLKKGTLQDDLEIKLADGTRVSILGYSQYARIAMATVDSMFHRLGESIDSRYRNKLRADVYHQIVRRAPLKKKEKRKRKKLIKRLREVMGDSDESALISYFIDTLIANYCQVVIIPQGAGAGGSVESPGPQIDSERRTELITLTFRRIQDLVSPDQHWFDPRLAVARLGVLLGVRPSEFEVSLENASRAESYHLEFMGPKGTYLARQHLYAVDPETKLIHKLSDDYFDYARVRKRRGQRYSHIYIRGGDEALRYLQAKAVFGFFERVPGSVGEVATTSVASTALIAMGGHILSRGDTPSSDFVALLLTFPIGAASWIGLSRGSVLLGGVLAARLGSIITILLSTVAASIALGVDLEWEAASGLSLLGARGIWAVLLVISLTVSVSLCASWLKRSRVYSAVLEKSDEKPGDLK